MRHTPALLAALAIALLLGGHAPLAGASDALLDAKRTAAAKLLKDGKTADAQKLYEEIIAADATTWSDHYALAKIYDKAGETPKAVEAYRQTTKLLKNKARATAERSALSDSEKRLKVLDELAERLEDLVRRFEAELRPIARDAEREKNAEVSERVEKLAFALASVTVREGRKVVSVSAASEWVDTGIDVAEGWTLGFAASGTWTTQSSTPAATSDANGAPATGMYNGIAKGALVGRIGTEGKIFVIGSQAELQMPTSGRLQLSCNDVGGRSDNAGTIAVLILKR